MRVAVIVGVAVTVAVGVTVTVAVRVTVTVTVGVVVTVAVDVAVVVGVGVRVAVGLGQKRSPSESAAICGQSMSERMRKIPLTMPIGVAVGVATPPPGVNVTLTVGVGVRTPPPGVNDAVGVGDAPSCTPSRNTFNPANPWSAPVTHPL